MFQLVPFKLTDALDAGDTIPIPVAYIDRQRIASSGHYLIHGADRYEAPIDFEITANEHAQGSLTWRSLTSIPADDAVAIGIAYIDTIVKVESTSENPLVVEALSGSVTPLGYQKITGLNVAKQLTVPEGANYALITPSTQAVRWRDDGGTPTASDGYPLPVAKELYYDGELEEITFIEQSASATLDVAYYA